MGTQRQVRKSLDDLWRINRFLNGIGSLTAHLGPRLREHDRPITVLDVGAGAAQVAAALARWGTRNGFNIHVYALDLTLEHLELGPIAANPPPNLHILQGDAFHPPLRTVDYMVSSLLMHHFAPTRLARLLCKLARHTRHALIMSDLVRGRLPQVAWLLGTPLFARGAITRHDGMASIRRAYTPRELLQLTRNAGLLGAQVQQHVPWRQVLMVPCDG